MADRELPIRRERRAIRRASPLLRALPNVSRREVRPRIRRTPPRGFLPTPRFWNSRSNHLLLSQPCHFVWSQAEFAYIDLIVMLAGLWSGTEAPRVRCGEAREQSWKSQLRPKRRFIDALPKFSVLQVRIIENIAGVCHRIPDHFAPKCLVEEFGFRILHE